MQQRSMAGVCGFRLVATAGVAVAVVLAGSGVASAQMMNLGQPQAATPPDPSTLPTLMFDRVEHNFGTIFDDQRVSTRLEFWNDGPGALEILDWRGSCSCTAGVLYREGDDPDKPIGTRGPDGTLPRIIYMPGQRGWLDIEFDPNGKAGMQAPTVTFTINDPRGPVRTFRIVANVLPLVSIEPQIADFGRVTKGRGSTIELRVTGRSEDFEVLHASVAGNENVRVEIHETIELVRNDKGEWVPVEPSDDETSPVATVRKAPEGVHDAAAAPPDASADSMMPIVPDRPESDRLRRTRLTLTLAPDTPPGRLHGSVSVRTNDPRRESLVTSIVGEVMGDIGVTPRQLAMGILPPETMFERRIQVLSQSGVGFRIERVEEISNLPESHRLNIKVDQITGGPNQGFIVTIRGRVPATMAQIQGEFRIHTSLDSERIITVPFFGHVQGQR